MPRIVTLLLCSLAVLATGCLLGASCGSDSAPAPTNCPVCTVCEVCSVCPECPSCPETPVCIEWIKPTLELGWVDEGAWYCVDETKVVRFRGAVHFDGFCASTLLSVFRMPEGLWPTSPVILAEGVELDVDGWLSVDVTRALNSYCGVAFSLEGWVYVAAQ